MKTLLLALCASMVSIVAPVQTVVADDKEPAATAYSVAVTGVT